MNIKKITVSKGVTISVGKFESVRCDASVEIEIGKGEDEDEVFETAFELVDAQLNSQIAENQPIIANTSVFKEEEKPKSSKRRRG
jgi:hypothetical protein